jgi:hypothetical protein
MMSQEDYKANQGKACPACESRDINVIDCEVDDCGAIADVKCLSCKAVWSEIYTLECYCNLEVES